ncbi:hypothetical protein [Streptomyces sp. UNOC14_S4]|uniref:hypothetical protein n=1 Tax=Streptomyces sp. UNOC14_S4 TaxID=2872340 RepID=UPI001E5204FF|nr:hypothetical protein [Streptomyces sp. UNOC14_S4]MCC3769614.1 hypothetical protein [Streptomyces sp. UNOC14_S4]
MGKLTYRNIIDVSLDNLARSVADWKEMATQLGQASKDAQDGMLRKANQARWAGVNSDVTKDFIRKTVKEFQDAHTEATSIWAVLDQAHTDLVWAQTNIKDAVKTAQEHGLTVLDSSDGTVQCIFSVCSVGDAQPTQADQDRKQSLEDRINSLIAMAQETDEGVARALGKSHGGAVHDFGHAKYESIEDARNETKTNLASEDSEYTHPNKFGSGTIKPAAEFLSYRSWLKSGEAALQGHFHKSWEYFLGGTPSYSGGLVSKGLEKNIGGGGRHRKPSAVNILGKTGGRIFGIPVALAATAVDFYYTPPGENKEGPTSVVAPKEPGRVKYKP